MMISQKIRYNNISKNLHKKEWSTALAENTQQQELTVGFKNREKSLLHQQYAKCFS
jgi:hypothetical protein